jgi:O-acetyl-ADP-ribose deacetylase (regulator of RNase III)
MITKQGDVFTTELRAIGHGVNVVGVMGAGVAALVARKFPKAEQEYKAVCATGTLQPGGSQVVRVDMTDDELARISVPDEVNYSRNTDDHLIVNIASQANPGPDARLDWLENAVRNAVFELKEMWGVDKMAIPQIGCGIGGLDWADVEGILEEIELSMGFEFEVWVY